MALPSAVPRFGLLAVALLAVLLLVGLPGLGQGILEPQGELATAECYGHHKAEGFRSMDLYPLVLAEVPAGDSFEFQLTIRNPWLHDLLDVYGYVNISGATGLSFPGEKDPVPVADGGTMAASPNAYVVAEHEIPVDVNATELVVALAGAPSPASAAPRVGEVVGNDFDLTIVRPDGQVVATGPDPATGDPVADARVPISSYEEVRVDQANLTVGGAGPWVARVSFRGPASADYALSATAYYNLSRATQYAVPGPAKLGPGEEHTFTFAINARQASDLQALRYGGQATAYHKHTDASIGDDGYYDKWSTITFETGDELVVGAAIVRTDDLDLLSPILRRWAQVLGFAASFLIVPSLVFGGTFGSGSVTLLNKLMGGARRRVLLHNSMSFWLLGLSVLHMFLFFYEAFWNWSHGLVWGGLSLACMIGLGITGATQRRFVAQWGFARWRFVHFGLGILVFVFVLVHLVADGSHLAPVRAWFG